MISGSNQKKAVFILLIKDDLILTVSRKNNPDDFNLPGGKVDQGETEEEAVVRELKEETGLDITNIRKIFTNSAYRDYLASYWTGDFTGSIQTTEKGVVKWIDQETLFKGSFGEYNRLLFKSLILSAPASCYY